MRHTSITILPVLFLLCIIANKIYANQNVSNEVKQNILKIVCVDKDGKQREVGESWKETCNICRCIQGGEKGCTRSSCLEDDFSEINDESLFKNAQMKKKMVIIFYLLIPLLMSFFYEEKKGKKGSKENKKS